MQVRSHSTALPGRSSDERGTARSGRAGRLLALVLVAALGAACTGGDDVDPGAEFEDPTSPPDAPGVEPEPEAETPDGADVTAVQIGLPPLEIRNGRGYPYRITAEVSHFSTEVALGDPGRTRLLVEAQLDLAVENTLDDRPAPFVIGSDGGGVRFDVLFPMDEALAAELHEERTASLPGQGSDVPYLSALDIGGAPFLRSVARARGSSLASADRSFLDLQASEVAAWEVWTVPFGSEPTADRGPSQVFGFGERGWDEDFIAQLDAVYAGTPAYLRLEFGRDVFDKANCEDSDGSRSLVHYFDVAAGTWLEPEDLPFSPACTPIDWKQN